MAASFSVFLSYRRDDTRHLSARIYEQLERHFGEGHVFFDVDTLPRYAGWDFEDVIRETVPQCRVFLAIIGRDWARLMRARLRDAKDFVQIELAIALNTPGVRVIPVLVDGAAMPNAADLPEALRGLLGKQNVVLPPDPHLRQAVNDLAKTLLAAPAQPTPPPVQPRPPAPAPPAPSTATVEPPTARAPPAAPERLPPPRSQSERMSVPASPAAGLPKWLMPAGGAGLALAALLLWSPWNRNSSTVAEAPPMVAVAPAGSPETPAAEPTAPVAPASFVDARTTPASTRAPVVRNPASLPDFALFRECEGCPELVVIPGGSFQMGSPAGEAGRFENEDSQSDAGGSQVRVQVPRFAISRFETTWDEWAACVSAGVCRQQEDSGYGRGRRPAINVDWRTDTRAFIRFANSRASGYRLPSEAEWEYAARAGTSTRWSFGDAESQLGAYAWFSGNAGSKTQPVGGKAANPWGLFDMHGNVWEWVEDCYNQSLANTPANGAANTTEGCSYRVNRGGGWYGNAQDLRSADRIRYAPTSRDGGLGFRVARTL
jgi:formylglycine-generating enzyme required for sulfatase activity